MKYKAVIETDDFEDFEFFEDGSGKYIHGIDAGSMNGEWIALYFTECKQESILDKIRAEIEQIESTIEGKVSDIQGNKYKYEMILKTTVLDIIDKYKAESEEV